MSGLVLVAWAVFAVVLSAVLSMVIREGHEEERRFRLEAWRREALERARRLDAESEAAIEALMERMAEDIAREQSRWIQ